MSGKLIFRRSIRFCAAIGRIAMGTDLTETASREQSADLRLDPAQDLVAYFCMEFGLHEGLKLYSGGMGILAGDHVKAASDYGVPLVAVGLLYHQGYFDQTIDREGQQLLQEAEVVPVRGVEGEEVGLHRDFVNGFDNFCRFV